MFTADTLVTRYVLDDSAHHSGANRVVRDTQRVGMAQRQWTSDANAGFTRFGRTLAMGVTAGAAFTASIVAVGAAIIGAGLAAAHKAAEFEALENSLAAVTGNAKLARKELGELRDIAKAPGIDIEGAVKAFTGLRFSNLDSDFAKELIRQSGNANAIAGGGREQFESILRAIKQIASNEFLMGDELMQLAEAGVPAKAWIKEMFGTADTERLKKAGIESRQVLEALVLKMSELPRASGGAKNAIENMTIAMQQAEVEFGKGILGGILGSVEDAAKGLEAFIDAGVFKMLGETIADHISSALSLFNADSLQDAMVSLLGITVTVSAATRNFILNLQDLFSLMKFFSPLPHLLPALGGGASLSPTAEGERAMDVARGSLEVEAMRREKDRKEREAAEKERQEKLAAARDQTRAGLDAAKDALAGGEDDKKKEQVKHLRDIADNTKKIADLQQSVFGGSELGKMGNPAREMAQIRKGGGSRGRSGGGDEIDQIGDLLRQALARMSATAAKAQIRGTR